MAGNISDTFENRMLDWSVGNTTTAPATPIKCALVTVAGSDSAAGTEVTGGSYARQTVAFSASSGGTTSNSGALTFTLMPACTVVGLELWDSTGTPVRIWYGPLSASKTVNVGDTFGVAVGAISLALD
jgi:hypothetical protein